MPISLLSKPINLTVIFIWLRTASAVARLAQSHFNVQKNHSQIPNFIVSRP